MISRNDAAIMGNTLRRREILVAILQFPIPLLFYFAPKSINMRFLITTAFLFFISCNNKSTGNVFDKLVGIWQSEDGKSFEQWSENDNGTYRSVAFSVNGADTSWNEQASIYPENDKWVFENTVKGQNNGKAVRFVSSALSDNSVQFSNPAHDFPTDINYTLPDANIVHAFIIGPNGKGGKDTIPFNYVRLK
jgi:hypothetical protein